MNATGAPEPPPIDSPAPWVYRSPAPQGDAARAATQTVLAIAVKGRIRLFLRGLLMLLSAAAGVAFSTTVIIQTDLPVVTRIVVPLMGLCLAAIGMWLGWVRLHASVLGKARLVVTPDAVIVEHPVMFRRPLQVGRDNLRVAAVDGDRAIRQRIGERKRFVITERRGERDISAALFSSRGGSPLPVIGHSKDVPNLVFLFHHPIQMTGARHLRAALFTQRPDLAPAPDRSAPGLLFSVADPVRAGDVFAAWGVLRPLTLADIDVVAPGEYEERRRKRLAWKTHVTVAVVFALTAAIGTLLAPPFVDPP